jgi:hypothetical protein
MEVHHHPKVEKKNFKEYFPEFLMIFLAVRWVYFPGISEKILVIMNGQNLWLKNKEVRASI